MLTAPACPFPVTIGQESMKLALLLTTIDPRADGGFLYVDAGRGMRPTT